MEVKKGVVTPHKGAPKSEEEDEEDDDVLKGLLKFETLEHEVRSTHHSYNNNNFTIAREIQWKLKEDIKTSVADMVMVELFIHHGGSINFVPGTYNGGDISYIGKKDPDYLSVVVFYKFVREDLGYLNVTRLAWKFDEAAGPFKLLESDDDCRHLSHYIGTPMFAIVEAGDAKVDEDKNDVEDEVEEVNLGGADDTELEDEDDMAGEDVREDPAEIFSDFVYSEEEQPELYPTVENEDEAAVARRNVISWFGSAPSVSRQTKEAPDLRGRIVMMETV
ncbi:hypothetical protein CJ030_MR3G009534 [Morella rubra]|uniref:PB1-like domain-containing protein n=1 Tax=Morella rubra TaxID=262757 RepID=A0A6A1W3U4_9ROSI|nr:hypothetical protein CJ030_MR3G009534 [Morella rubra]